MTDTSKRSSKGMGCVFLFALPFATVGAFATWFLFSYSFKCISAQMWPTVPAKILTADLSSGSSSKSSTTYRAKGTYSYVVNGIEYTGDKISYSFGSDNIGDFHRRAYQTLQEHLSSGEPLPIYVNPNDPKDSVVFPELRIALLGFVLLFAVLFGGVGFGIIIGALMGMRSDRAKQALAQKYPNEPWKQRPEWSDGKVRSKNSGLAIVISFVALFWNSVSIPIFFIIGPELQKGNYAVLFALLFPLVGAGLIWWAVVLVIQWRRYGKGFFQLDAFPARIGSELRGTVYEAAKLPSDLRNVKVKLYCGRIVTVKTSKGSRTSEQEVWSSESEAPVVGGGQSGVGTAIKIKIPISNMPELIESGGTENGIWKLSLSAEIHGVDYANEFEIPVFR